MDDRKIMKKKVFIAPQKRQRNHTIFNRYVAGRLNSYSIEKDAKTIEKQLLVIQAFTYLKMQHPIFNVKFYEYKGELYIPYMSPMMRIVEKPIELGRRNIIYYEGLSHYDDIVEAVFELPQTLLNKHYNESFMLLKNKGYIKEKNPHETLHRLGTRYMNALYKSSFISFIRFYFIPMYLSVMLPAFFVLVMMSLNVSNPLLSGEDLAAGLFFLGPPTLYYFFGLIKTLRKSDFEKQFY